MQLVTVNVRGQVCGVVGTEASEFEAYREQNFYLNTQDTTPCDGTVTEFQFCYHRSDQGLAASYDFTFAVFRETSPGTYTAVSDAFTTGVGPNLDPEFTFACGNFQAPSELQVQAGDMIGACVYDPPDGGVLNRRVQRDVVSENAGIDRYLMVADNSGCGDFSVPSSVDMDSLSEMNSLILHISANIGEY